MQPSRGARAANLLMQLSLISSSAAIGALLLLAAVPGLDASHVLSCGFFTVSLLAAVLAISGIVTGLAAGIGFPLSSAFSLILGLCLGLWSLLMIWMTARCPESGC